MLERLFPDLGRERRSDLPKLAAMMGLFFVVVCAVGILRPIKNALALDGLPDSKFYQVYLVSAVVVLFVPPYNRLSDRVAWRWLIPGVAVFFALNLVLFRIFYREGSAAYGMIFYGWYDLFAAALVTQFFMATQLFFNARSARQAYPLVIGGGAVGAALGGGITAVFAHRLGTPNLLLVAAGFIALFGAGLPFAWPGEEAQLRGRSARTRFTNISELKAIFGDPHVRLIAASVLLTILVKQLVDYQFNTLTEEVYRTRDAMTAFQGTFNAATQWLPLVVLAVLRPALTRWGVGFAVFLLPVFMLAGNAGLVIASSLSIAVGAKAADMSLRYSAERTGREILYVPVPEHIKLKAKTYIDVAIEKGVGKVAAAGLIWLLLAVAGPRLVPVAGVLLSVVWLLAAVAVRREYVRTLSQAIEGRFATLRGGFASLTDASTLPIVQRALTGGDTLQASFALDMVEQASASDVRPLAESIAALLDHDNRDVRARALRILARVPANIPPERVRDRLEDPSAAVREAAVRAMVAVASDPDAVLRDLLTSGSSPVRRATLACLARGEIEVEDPGSIGAWYMEHRSLEAQGGDVEARIEMALATASLRDQPGGRALLLPFLEAEDPRVRAAAFQSAGLLGDTRVYPQLIAGLRHRATREAARDALLQQGHTAVEALIDALNDPAGDPLVRRQLPGLLARIPTQQTADALLESFLAPETDQLLDYRALKAMGKLRRDHPELTFDRETVMAAVEREADAGERYLAARAVLEPYEAGRDGVALLRSALHESWEERRETAFRCLGLLYPADACNRCFITLTTGRSTARANALEWLEQTVGRSIFVRLGPILDHHRRREEEPPLLRIVLGELLHDNDTWLGRCAVQAAADLGIRLPAPPAVLAWPDPEPSTRRRKNGMDLIEKVFLLQQVDLLQDARSAHLALLASIAEEVETAADEALLERGEPTEAMYIVIRGAVLLKGVGEQLITARDGTPFGTWALIDESPSLVGARTQEPTRLLRISRADFYDLLADYPELAMGMLQGLARRVRTLVA